MANDHSEQTRSIALAIKDTVVFQASEEFNEALAEFAQNNDRSKANVIREAVAAFINYDLSAEPKTERRRKYASKEERDAAMKLRAKERRDTTRAILQAIERGERDEAIRAMAASLKKRDGE